MPKPDKLAARAVRLVTGFAAATATLTLVAACGIVQDGRFPTCENDDECKKRNPDKAICFNLQCVGCGVDSDCPSDKPMCNRKSHSCTSLK